MLRCSGETVMRRKISFLADCSWQRRAAAIAVLLTIIYVSDIILHYCHLQSHLIFAILHGNLFVIACFTSGLITGEDSIPTPDIIVVTIVGACFGIIVAYLFATHYNMGFGFSLLSVFLGETAGLALSLGSYALLDIFWIDRTSNKQFSLYRLPMQRQLIVERSPPTSCQVNDR